MSASSVFSHPEAILLCPPTAVADFGPTLIVAPHPDDESLGCGGAIALLVQAGCPVQVLVVSDGTKSHPNSRRYPTPRLRALREAETTEALECLGLSAEAVTFLGLQDGQLPFAGAPFEAATEHLRRYFQHAGRPQTVLLPWRRDPHPDHRAAFALVVAALSAGPLPRLIEYPVWLWDTEQVEARHLPEAREVHVWRLDIATVIERKHQAIAAHRSQTTDLIDDDPAGFRLLPQMRSHFERPWEVYLEVNL